MAIGDVFRDFANWSTVGGVPHIANARTWIVRLFWTIVVLLLLSIFIYQLYLMIKQFIEFPSIVNTDILVQAQIFPAVTICNLNPYKASTSNAFISELKSFMVHYEEVVDETATVDTFGLMNQPTTYDRDARARDAVNMIAAKYTTADKEIAMYQFEEMIADCTFNGVTCDTSEFTTMVDPVFGRCFTYNNLVNSTKSVSRAGKTYGLRMLITVRQTDTDNTDNLFLPTSNLAGAKVAVHSPGEYPNLEGTALTVGVGYTTAVAITTAEYKLSKKPYGDCVDREAADRDYYKTFKYNSLTCYNGCRQRDTMAKCSCYNPRYLAPDGATFCPPTKQNVDCLDTLKGDQASDTQPNMNPLEDCGCQPPCQESTFALTTSLSQFPTDGYTVVADSENGTAQSLGSCTEDNSVFDDVATCEDWYANNALQLQVFYETMRSEKYTEESSYGISAMVNDLGGQAGLYLGLSIISCVEVVGLFFMLCCFCCSGGKVMVKPHGEEFEKDHRIREVEDLRRMLDDHDSLDKKEKQMKNKDMDDDDDEKPKEAKNAESPKKTTT